MKTTLRKLRLAINEQFARGHDPSPFSVLKTLVEADDVDHVNKGASLDFQVDRYLASYEKDATNGVSEGIIREADDDEGEDGNDAEEAVPSEPTKLKLDSIDMESFVDDVARLIENYDNLLEVRSTIARRAINFISKNYDADTVKELKSIFKNNHSIIPGEDPEDHEAFDFKAPPAGEAGPL